MSKTFLYSDPHFSHWGVCRFLRDDGTKLRPWDNPDDMDKDLIQMFNDTVSEKDKCYFLGDVAINRRGLKVLHQIRCKNLVLIKGNHCIFKLDDYTPFFRDIRAYHVLDNFLLSHIPIHPDSLSRFNGSIHGHTHANVVLDNKGKPDPRYFCVCVEQTEFKPILLEDAFERAKRRGGTIGFKERK